MLADVELLQRYAENGSEEMFAELVRRHLPLVYAAALRQVHGAVHRAEDVTQTVFIELARNARKLMRRSDILGWLYTTTHYTAAKLKRGEQRRQVREQEAHLMQEIETRLSPEIESDRLGPVLDEAMHALSEGDREIILMRFFQSRRFADVGRALGLSEDGARMRVERALDRLRVGLGRREITSTTAALAVALANQPAVFASASFAATVTGAALAGGGTAAGGGAWMTFMSMTKLHLGIASTFATAAVVGLVWQAQGNSRLNAVVARLRQENAELAPARVEHQQLTRLDAEVANLRLDEDKLARLNEEAGTLQGRLERVARAEKQRAAQIAAAVETVDLAKLDGLPRAVHRLRSPYPIALRDQGVGGEVLIEFIVDANGVVREAHAVKKVVASDAPPKTTEFSEVIRLETFTIATPPGRGDSAVSSSGQIRNNRFTASEVDELLQAAALEAVSQWKFEPGRLAGNAVNSRLQVPFVCVVTPAPIPGSGPSQSAVDAPR